MYPVDYDYEKGISFGVDVFGKKTNLAKITVKTIDGTPVDALSGEYGFEDVYVDVDLSAGNTDDPTKADLMLWIIRKLKKMGYTDNGIRIDSKLYSHKPTHVSDDAIDVDTMDMTQSDTELDMSTYWDRAPSDDVDDDSSDIAFYDDEEEEEETKSDKDEVMFYDDDEEADSEDDEDSDEEETDKVSKKKLKQAIKKKKKKNEVK